MTNKEQFDPLIKEANDFANTFLKYDSSLAFTPIEIGGVKGVMIVKVIRKIDDKQAETMPVCVVFNKDMEGLVKMWFDDIEGKPEPLVLNQPAMGGIC